MNLPDSGWYLVRDRGHSHTGYYSSVAPKLYRLRDARRVVAQLEDRYDRIRRWDPSFESRVEIVPVTLTLGEPLGS